MQVQFQFLTKSAHFFHFNNIQVTSMPPNKEVKEQCLGALPYILCSLSAVEHSFEIRQTPSTRRLEILMVWYV